MIKKYQVFISSTFTDLGQERQDAIRTVLDLGHIPSGMEIFPATDVEQFKYITKVIDECDYYVLIIGGRYGSMDEAGISFTEKEYGYAVDQRKIILAFIHGDPTSIAVSKSDTDPVLAAKLTAFREKVSKGRLVQFWKTSEELKYRLTVALAKAFSDSPAIGWIRGNAAASEDLLAKLNDLRNVVDELQVRNQELMEQAKPQLAGVAGLNETFTVRYGYKIFNSYQREFETFADSVALTWAEIFVAVGPILMRPIVPDLLDSAIIKYINENTSVQRESINLYDTDTNRIKIQLLALGLISSEMAGSKGGGIQEFLSLTPWGKRHLLELMAVKSATSPASTN